MLNFGEGRFYDRMRYVCMYVYVCIAAVHHRKSGNKGKQLVKLVQSGDGKGKHAVIYTNRYSVYSPLEEKLSLRIYMFGKLKKN